MKIMVSLFCLAFSFGIFTQNFWDDSFFERKTGERYAVYSADVNIRKSPDLKSGVLFRVQPGDFVTIVAKTGIQLEIDSVRDYWYEIDCAGKHGFVWGALLADYYFEIDGTKILGANGGLKKGIFRLKISSSKNIFSEISWASGPVDSSRGFEVKKIPLNGFDNPPDLMFTFSHFVFSEIEGGTTIETFFTVKDGKLSRHFDFIPGACDPPSAMESFLVIPGESLPADDATAREEYKGEKNTLKIVIHSFDCDDASVNEYSCRNMVWNGRIFISRDSAR